MAARLIRFPEAAERLGYAPSSAHYALPRLLPIYRLPTGRPNSLLCVLSDDLDRLLDEVTARPVKGCRR